jgi:hypothetical protein
MGRRIGSGGELGGKSWKSWRLAQEEVNDYTNDNPREQDFLNSNILTCWENR